MTRYCAEDSRSALLRIPSDSPGVVAQVPCTYQEMRGRRLSIESPVGVLRSTAVSVEYEDALYLGEVVTSAPIDGTWQLEINIEQILSGLNSLIALRDRLLCERATTPLAIVPAGSRN